MNRPSPRTALFVCWCLAVVVASVVDPPSGGLAATGPFGVGVDKWIHLGTYAVTAFLAGVAFRARGLRGLAGAVAVAVALGVGIELVQATLPARAFGVGDAAANALGAGGGAATYAAVRRRWPRGESPPER